MNNYFVEKGLVGAEYSGKWFLYDVSCKKFLVYNSEKRIREHLKSCLEDVEIIPEPDFTGPATAAAITLTTRCNMECDYCFVKPVAKKMDMPVNVVRDAVNAIGKQTDDDITLFAWGGEPTLNRDGLLAMVTEAEKYPNIKICLVTNGIINEAFLIELLSYKNLVFQISYDGNTQHDKQKPLQSNIRSLPQVLNSIEMISRVTKRLALRATVTKNNISELRESLLLTVAKYTNRLMIEHIHTFNGKAIGLDDLAPDFDEFNDLVFNTINIAEKNGIHVKVLPLDHLRAGGPNDKMTFLNFLPDRNIGVSNAVIDSQHKHFPFVHIGNLKQDTIQYNVDQGESLANRYLMHYKELCKNCIVRPVCRGSVQRYLFITNNKTIDKWNDLRCKYFISIYKRWMHSMVQEIQKEESDDFEGNVLLKYPIDKIHYPMLVMDGGLGLKFQEFDE